MIAVAVAGLVACGGSRHEGPTKTTNSNINSNTNTNDNTNENTNSNTNDNTNTNNNTAPEGVELNTGWIGGTCSDEMDCSSDAFNDQALCEKSGFPGGHCTQACSESPTTGNWVCPDEDYESSATDFTVTRCIPDEVGAPRCVSECNFEKSPTGCRPGYACILQQRYSSTGDDNIFPVCLPADLQRWPGAPEVAFDIGGSCSSAADCGSLACLRLNGGYCSKYMCDLTGCPVGSSCFRFGNSGEVTACLQDCVGPQNCRTAENYECLSEENICWPDFEPPAHDPSVAAADCTEAWGTGGDLLHSCDATPDDYLVINKAARNISHCNAGSVVATYATGLGFSPTGDKEAEGDGRTPEGVFFVSSRLPNSEFYRAFLLSYPNSEDATRGVTDGLITADQAAAITSAEDSCGVGPQTTNLGGYIEVHGRHAPSQGDWTWGCAAIEDGDMDALWDTIDVGDTIVVKP